MAAMPDALPPPPPAETILVTGRAITTAAGGEAFGQVTLTAQALEPASGRIEDALRGIGGVQLFRAASTRTSNPTADGLTARGFAGNAASRVDVTLDGVPLADPFFGFVAWGLLVGQPIESAELVRGGGRGGPGALAGTLTLTSGTAGTGAQARLGSRGSFEGDVVLAAPVAGGQLSLAGGMARGDGHLLVAAPGPADVPARYRQWSLAGQAGGTIGALTLSARLAGFDDRRLRGIEGADIESNGADASLTARLDAGWTFGLAAFAKLRDFSTVTRTLDASRTTATTALDQVKTPASGWGLNLTAEPRLGDDLALQLGAGWRAAEGQTIERFRFVAGAPTRGRVAGGTQQVASLWFDGSYRPAPDLLLTAAGRLDHWRLGAGSLREFDLATSAVTLNQASAAREGNELTGRLGAVWRPTGALRLRAAGYRGWRLPTLNELYRPFRAGADATAANPLLEPERLLGVEASLGFEPLAAVNLSATGFWNRLDDPVANVTLGVGPGVFPGVGFVAAGGRYRQRQNLASIESRGIELDGSLGWGAFAVTLSGAFVDATVTGGGLDGLRPAQAPELSGSIAGSYRGDGLAASVTLRHLGPRFEDDQNSRRLPAATTLDADADLRISGPLSVTFAVENLFDARIATGFSGDQFERGQPRTVWLGIRVSAAGS